LKELHGNLLVQQGTLTSRTQAKVSKSSMKKAKGFGKQQRPVQKKKPGNPGKSAFRTVIRPRESRTADEDVPGTTGCDETADW
jgi:hypothetical protein